MIFRHLLGTNNKTKDGKTTEIKMGLLETAWDAPLKPFYQVYWKLESAGTTENNRRKLHKDVFSFSFLCCRLELLEKVDSVGLIITLQELHLTIILRIVTA